MKPMIALALALLCSPSVSRAAEEHPPFVQTFAEPHAVQVLEQGLPALELRLQMIERARVSIDAEYFIYATDKSARLFTQALVRKKLANPRLRVRLLLDASEMVLALDPFYVAEIARHGVEVRYYNPAPLIALITTQYRNHRKVMIVDGQEAITGGRNIADEYFDLGEKFNFLDRDIWVRGPVVGALQASFDAYWSHRRVKAVPAPQPPSMYPGSGENDDSAARYFREDEYRRKTALATAFLEETAEDRHLRAEVARLARPRLAESSLKGRCEVVRTVSDEPGFEKGMNRFSAKRRVREEMLERVGRVPEGQHLYVESPYFIVEGRGADAIEGLAERHVKTTLLTNSLASTDAFYVAAHFLPRVVVYASKSEGEIFAYSGRAMPDTLLARDRAGRPYAAGATWGIHAKTFVFDQRSFAIGTFNIDPRSANLNTEMMLICEQSPALTRQVRRLIDARIAQSQLLGQNGAGTGGSGLEGASFSKVLMFVFSLLPSTVFDFLL